MPTIISKTFVWYDPEHDEIFTNFYPDNYLGGIVRVSNGVKMICLGEL